MYVPLGVVRTTWRKIRPMMPDVGGAIVVVVTGATVVVVEPVVVVVVALLGVPTVSVNTPEAC